MKPWIILIVLAVTLTAAATVAVPFLSTDSTPRDLAYPAPAKPDGPPPVAEVEGPLVYDFGVLPQQHSGAHVWTFKNTGSGTLELRGAGKTCSCTTAALFGERDQKEVAIKPGESLPIEVTFSTKNWDKFHQSVTVGTNDPQRPTIVLTIDGIVRQPITTVPADPAISYGAVGNEGQVTRLVGLYSQDRPDLKLTKVTTTNPALLTATPRPMSPEEVKSSRVEKGYTIEVTLQPTSNLGSFAEEVLVETDHPQRPELRFKVVGKVTGPITLVPERITVRGANSSRGGIEKIKVVARGRSKVNFTVEKKPKDLEVAIEPMTLPAGSKGSMYMMTVKVTPGAESGRITDQVILKTDDPLASEIKVPVDVLIEGSN